jgi:hypothetical protein
MPPEKNLIIGGTTRAGTTALFLYLADHPSVCRAIRKETRFFLDPDYPLERVASYQDGMDTYSRLFGACADRPVWLEATPDYLHSPGTGARIAETLRDVHLVFILRDPIDRLLSWYRYAIQRGLMQDSVTLEDWIRGQLEHPPSENAPQHERILAQGRYSRDLEAYFKHFDRRYLHIWPHSDVQRDSRRYLIEICDAVGIASDFYVDYALKPFNPSFQPRHARLHQLYGRLAERIRVLFLGRRGLRQRLARVKRPLDRLYRRINAAPGSAVALPEALRVELETYYEGEAERLEALTGVRPWRW